MTQPCPPSPVALSVTELILGTEAGWDASVAAVAVDDSYVYATHCLVGIQNRHESPRAGELIVYPREELREAIAAGASPPQTRLTTGWQPSSVASLVRSDYRRVFVVNYHQESYSVTMFDRDTWTAFPEIHIGQVPIDVAVHAKRGRAYVSDWYGGFIHVIDAKTGVLLAGERIEIGKGLVGVTVDEATDTLFVARNYHSSTPLVDELVLVDLVSGKVSRRVTLPSPGGPRDVVYDATTGLIYVSMINAMNGVCGVLVLDRADLAKPPKLIGTTAGVDGLALSGTGYLFAAVGGRVEVLDLKRGLRVGSQTMARRISGVAVDKASGDVYAGDDFDGQLHRIAPLVTQSPIGQHPDVLNGTLGSPLGAPMSTPDGQGVLQAFQFGTAVATADFGAVAITPAHASKWLGGNGFQLRAADADDLGNPTGDTVTTPDGVIVTYFERGCIVTQPGAPQDVVVSRGIWEKYRDLGDVTSWLGLPVSAAVSMPGDLAVQAFVGGVLVFHADAGGHAMREGEIFSQWMERFEGATGPLGSPTADEVELYAADQVSVLGRWCQFQQGALVMSNAGEVVMLTAHFVRGWQAHGGPGGALGMPVSDSTRRDPAYSSSPMYTNFENGLLAWFPPNHPLTVDNGTGVHAVTSLEMFISRFESGQSGDEVDLYVRYYFDDSTGAHREGTLPEDGGSYGTDDVDVAFTHTYADVLRGDLEVSFLLRGRDDDTFPDPDGDDTIGVVSRQYTLDNLWGIKDGVVSDTGHEDGGHFSPTWVMRAKPQAYDPSRPFRSQWAWHFNNFDTPRMSLSVYDQTFADVHAGLQVHWNLSGYADEGWEALFYQMYKKVGKDGNCVGMSIEALYSAHNRSAFGEPISQHGHPATPGGTPDPDLDKELIEEINIKHGYQVGSKAILTYAWQIGSGVVNDGREVFIASLAAYLRGDWPVLCMVREWKNSGHCVLPFRWVRPEDPSQPWEIWLADPSKPPPLDSVPAEELDPKWRILVHPDGSWTYRDSYNSAEPRWLFHVPFSVFAQQPRTPSWETLGQVLAQAGMQQTLFIVSGEADTHQVGDAGEQTLYRPDLIGPPRTPADLRVLGRVGGLSRIPLFGGPDGPLDSELHLAVGAHPELVHEVVGRSARPYHWAMRTGATAAILTVPGDTRADHFHAERLGTATRGVGYSRPIAAPAKRIKLMLEAMPKDRLPRQHATRQFLLSDVGVIGGQRLAARVADGGGELLLSTQDGPLTAQLRLRGTPDSVLSKPRTLSIEAGRTALLRPADWSPSGLNNAPVRVEIRETVDGPPVQCFDLLPEGQTR